MTIVVSGFRRRSRADRAPSGDDLIVDLLWQLRALGLPEPAREHRFHPFRRWRFDLAWPSRRVYAEIQGATWTAGRHSRGPGHRADADKQNAAVALGWRPVLVTADMVADGTAALTIAAALPRRPTDDHHDHHQTPDHPAPPAPACPANAAAGLRAAPSRRPRSPKPHADRGGH